MYLLTVLYEVKFSFAFEKCRSFLSFFVEREKQYKDFTTTKQAILKRKLFDLKLYN